MSLWLPNNTIIRPGKDQPGYKPPVEFSADRSHPHLFKCVHWFPCNEEDGDYIYDLISDNHGEIIQGAARITIDGQRYIDQTAFKADCPAPDQGISTQLSVIAWFSKFTNGRGLCSSGWIIETYANKYYCSPNGSTWTTASPVAASTDLRMFVWTFDSVSNESVIYEDGVVLVSGSNTGSILRSAIFRFYRDFGNFAGYFTLKDMRIYDRVLPADEVRSMYLDYYAPAVMEPDYIVIGSAGAAPPVTTAPFSPIAGPLHGRMRGPF